MLVPRPMDARIGEQDETYVARSLAGEDLRRGDFVAVLNWIGQYPSFLWGLDAVVSPPSLPVRIEWHADEMGLPLKVKAVCLPFVCVKSPCGKHRTLDLRQVRLVRLGERYARTVWKALRRESAAGRADSLAAAAE